MTTAQAIQRLRGELRYGHVSLTHEVRTHAHDDGEVREETQYAVTVLFHGGNRDDDFVLFGRELDDVIERSVARIGKLREECEVRS